MFYFWNYSPARTILLSHVGWNSGCSTCFSYRYVIDNTNIYYFLRLIYWLTDRTSMLWVRILIRARCITLCDTVCQWHARRRWFSPGPPVSPTKKKKNWPPRYNLNIVGSCVNHHQTNKHTRLIGFYVSHPFNFFSVLCFCVLFVIIRSVS